MTIRSSSSSVLDLLVCVVGPPLLHLTEVIMIVMEVDIADEVRCKEMRWGG